MASSSRSFIVANIALVALIGGMIWFLFVKEQAVITSPPTPSAKPATANATKSAISTEGFTAGQVQAINAIQTQLDAEKKRAENTRAQLQAREQETASKKNSEIAPPVVATAANSGTNTLEVEQQKQRISQMIDAQLMGAEEENKRLAQALLKKNQEIATVKKQNSALARKLIKLDNSAQTLLAKLVADGKTISSSDQDYLGAMQALQEETVSPQRSINFEQTDLINRVEISDNDDAQSIAAQLRSAVNDLMEKENTHKPTTSSSATTTDSGQSGDLQNAVNSIMERSEEQKSERQFRADSAYIDSLTPMEKERLNETRWVTVREGDTLYDIADRVYNDGWLYHKIFEANPQVLNNPDRIKTGQRLRVPF